MSDEEKNVIDLLKNIDKQKCLMLNCPVVKNNIERQLKIIELNRIIRKQSKEIEDLKKERLTLFDTTVKNSIKINDKKWEDKIKAKIEELEKLNDEATSNCYGYGIHFLRLLLEKE